MTKANYKYYLANGEYVEYSLSPDCSLIGVIDSVASQYMAVQFKALPDEVWVKPEIAAALNREYVQQFSLLLGNLSSPVGHALLVLQTIVGPLKIVPVSDLEYPIFLGSPQEYEDNSFNKPMEKILSE